MQHSIAEDRPHEAGHLALRSVVRLEPGHEIAHPVIAGTSAGLFDDRHQLTRHRQKLRHRHDIQHLRVDRDQDRGCRAERRHREETQLWRAVDYDDVVKAFDLRQDFADAGKEHRLRRPRRHRLRRLVLEFHQLEIARNEMEIWRVGGAHDVGDGARLLISDRTVDRFALSDVELRLMTEQGGQGGLRIEVDGEHAVASQRHELRQMGRSGGLARAALEIHDGDNLELLARPARRHIFRRSVSLVEDPANAIHIRCTVKPPSVCERIGPMAVGGHLAEITFADADKGRSFRRRKCSDRLLRQRGEDFCLMLLKLIG